MRALSIALLLAASPATLPAAMAARACPHSSAAITLHAYDGVQTLSVCMQSLRYTHATATLSVQDITTDGIYRNSFDASQAASSALIRRHAKSAADQAHTLTALAGDPSIASAGQ